MFLSDSIDKFKITKHRDGKYPAIITISGWRTQDKDNRKDWEESILKAFTGKSFFEEIKKELASDLKLSKKARNNPIENFKFGFDDLFMDKLIGRMEQNQDIFSKMMDDKDFGNLVKNYMLKKVYSRLNQ